MDACPDDDPKRPAGQGAVQEALGRPVVAPYRPAAHIVHTPAAAKEYCPTGQMAAVAFVDPATHAYPGTHVPEHTATGMADTFPKRPAGQSAHTLAPNREYLPATHASAVGDTLPAAHTYPAVHGAVHVGDDNPAVDPYRPA